MTELLLIRHGETEWNAAEIFRGRADIDLDETGILQANLLADYLKEKPIEAVYSSPLIRAVRTAYGIGKNRSFSVELEPGLIDFDYGEWQGMPLDHVRQIYKNLYTNWMTAPQKVKVPGGESLDEVKVRAMDVIDKVLGKHSGTVALVSHRVIHKVLICAFLGLDNSHFWNIRMDNCAVTSFSCENGQYILTGHNDVSFLKKLAVPKLSDF